MGSFLGCTAQPDSSFTIYHKWLVVLLQKEDQLRRERQETRVLRKQQEREMKERDRGSPFQYPTVENVRFQVRFSSINFIFVPCFRHCSQCLGNLSFIYKIASSHCACIISPLFVCLSNRLSQSFVTRNQSVVNAKTHLHPPPVPRPRHTLPPSPLSTPSHRGTDDSIQLYEALETPILPHPLHHLVWTALNSHTPNPEHGRVYLE